MGVCTGCKYFKECGNHNRQEPCVGRETESNKKPRSMYEREKARVYATGNKWAIENFHATHD